MALKKCYCGEAPTSLLVMQTDHPRQAVVRGSCCGKRILLFGLNPNHKLMDRMILSIAAWNSG